MGNGEWNGYFLIELGGGVGIVICEGSIDMESFQTFASTRGPIVKDVSLGLEHWTTSIFHFHDYWRNAQELHKTETGPWQEQLARISLSDRNAEWLNLTCTVACPDLATSYLRTLHRTMCMDLHGMHGNTWSLLHIQLPSGHVPAVWMTKNMRSPKLRYSNPNPTSAQYTMSILSLQFKNSFQPSGAFNLGNMAAFKDSWEDIDHRWHSFYLAAGPRATC